jgi:hypothetical protein
METASWSQTWFAIALMSSWIIKDVTMNVIGSSATLITENVVAPQAVRVYWIIQDVTKTARLMNVTMMPELVELCWLVLSQLKLQSLNPVIAQGEMRDLMPELLQEYL